MAKEKMTLLWFQTGTCGGDTMALLSADRPSFSDLLNDYPLELLWQPSLSLESPHDLHDLMRNIIDGKQRLDILCIEGSIVMAPNGTGMFDVFRKTAKKEWVQQLAEKARYVVAMGTCAAFGGVHAAPPNPSDCVGLQMDKDQSGGLFDPAWRSGAGYPVINVAGCPVHPNTMTKTLAMIASGIILQLDELNRPKEFFSSLVHQGCTRNEYHEYDVEESEFGTNGCMFFNLGCKGPYTQATCNTDLWNGRSSKTRAGVPCFGCTSPGFPEDEGLFRTEKLGPIPQKLPVGVERANYIAYKNLAKAAAPVRVKKRKMEP
ncbi:NADH ubiquinone oxidoreductase [Grimontia hollisae]|uniref:hydrogenase (acceptor) n=2 Tax=Grimontia hollisae TaxID=673 RepID=D0IAG8_GRIHO|nr:NADH ubiquinone oxidoreductase [Grimontia hollisae]EEY70886.1 uptake hydrogenase small subunit precursor [Grimontia hollisae CIP 101886]MDF2186293.1 NADH:ubiquinone oxidoreductase [Grimontia hollisae]STO44606.1 Periplasmic [NiFe] hydrogenase small subunit precursor [Grimontia hollisae]STO57471.1 Periplasmic [NiFe] hydrogenase small subunit precursor [Grimontia hollisae]